MAVKTLIAEQSILSSYSYDLLAKGLDHKNEQHIQSREGYMKLGLVGMAEVIHSVAFSILWGALHALAQDNAYYKERLMATAGAGFAGTAAVVVAVMGIFSKENAEDLGMSLLRAPLCILHDDEDYKKIPPRIKAYDHIMQEREVRGGWSIVNFFRRGQ